MEKIWLKNYVKGVPYTINPDLYPNLTSMFDLCCARYADDPFLISFNSELSYKKTQSLSNIFSGYLQNKLKLKKGDRIAILMPNIHQLPIAIFSALRLGLIVVNIPFSLGTDEIHKILKQTEPEALIFSEHLSPQVSIAIKNTSVKHVIITETGDLFPFVKRIVFHWISRYKKSPFSKIPGSIPFRKALKPSYANLLQPVEVKSDETAFLQFSNGREQAVPKCIEITHRNVIANTLQIESWIPDIFNSGIEKRGMNFTPLYRISSFLQILLSMRNGHSCVLILNPTDVREVVKQCSRPFSYFGVIQLLFNLYLKDPDFTNLDFSKLKICFGGGQFSSVTSAKWKALTKTTFLQTYVVSEATALVCLHPTSTQGYHDTVGLAVPSTEIKICDRNGVEQSINQKGEIWVRGPQIMKGYWRDPEKTSQVITKDGWLKTGDLGSINEDGYLSIFEPIADMIENNEKLFSSVDIENIINAVSGVSESAVVSAKLKTGQIIIKAFVVKNNPNLTDKDILQSCHVQLSNYQIPHSIEFLETLPKAVMGYVIKRELRDKILKENDK